MQQMVDSLKALPSKPRIFLATPIPAFKTQWTINDSTIVNGVIPIIYKVAKKNALEVIDLHTAFNNNDGKQIQRDMIHPTKEGARQMATIVAAEITKPLPQPTGKKARQRTLKK